MNNGAIYGMPEDFHLQIKDPAKTADLWIFGMLNAIPLLSAGLFGTTVSDPLQEYYLGKLFEAHVPALGFCANRTLSI